MALLQLSYAPLEAHFRFASLIVGRQADAAEPQRQQEDEESIAEQGRQWRLHASGKSGDLLLETQDIEVVPRFDDLSILDPHHAHAGERHLLSGRRESVEMAVMRSSARATDGFLSIAGYVFVDRNVNVRKRREESLVHHEKTGRPA